MSKPVLAELVPVGGGDSIPLMRAALKLGRRDSCDICLRFPNISGIHCEFSYKDGYWAVRDLNSTNGIKVNGQRLRFRPLRPGDRITIGKRDYTIQYDLHATGQKALESVLTEAEDVLNQSLMEKAGLTKSSRMNPFGIGDTVHDDDEISLDDEE
jgi:pSer/pThr/pTyr-binding forkhead associated (FHA) protein